MNDGYRIRRIQQFAKLQVNFNSFQQRSCAPKYSTRVRIMLIKIAGRK